ncbi:hypothetical protein [Aureibacillus halotolerans]|uniref:Phage protein Gp111 n=1 Tax=Aureibacillus halotolerans TaxID=1508390 RepID=A0A4R6U868_9BACI|nr:hypothetical protein [Aureibacillus halotolerans]TDQ39254.1 phage protein Gp111 [Aureibacillus halotolerans]
MNVMKRAWEIAREGVVRFGGKVVEYFAEALRMAWAEAKRPKKAEFVTSAGSRKHKSWVAKITGKHARFKFDRSFVKEVKESWVEKFFLLSGGLYEVCDGGERRFILVTGATVKDVQEYEVMEAIA